MLKLRCKIFHRSTTICILNVARSFCSGIKKISTLFAVRLESNNGENGNVDIRNLNWKMGKQEDTKAQRHENMMRMHCYENNETIYCFRATVSILSFAHPNDRPPMHSNFESKQLRSATQHFLFSENSHLALMAIWFVVVVVAIAIVHKHGSIIHFYIFFSLSGVGRCNTEYLYLL